MGFKSINVWWQSKSGSLSIHCQAHNAPGVLMTAFGRHGAAYISNLPYTSMAGRLRAARA